MKRRLIKLLRVLAATSMLIGGIGYFGSLWITGGSTDWLTDRAELPLAGLSQIEIDPEGRIVCALQSYNRIQVYEADGSFVRGWQVGSGNGRFRMRLDELRHLQVASVRDDLLYTFTMDGRLIGVVNGGQSAYFRYGDPQHAIAVPRSASGAEYRIAESPLYPHIILHESAMLGSSDETLIATPPYMWPFMAPVPALPLWMGGIYVLIITDRRYGDSTCAATTVAAH